MNITDQIEESGLFYKQPEPTDARYSMFNTGGVECEVGEFLYGLVRMLKPDHVLETGTHRGVGASYIGSALKDNGGGELLTMEFIKELWDEAQLAIDKQKLGDYVTCALGDVADFHPDKNTYDIIFLDTEPHLRFHELLQFWDSLKPGGLVIIHDLSPGMGQTGVEVNGMMDWPFGTLPDEIKQLIKTHQLQSFHFSTPRGIYIGQKKRDDGYSNNIL